MIPPLYQCGDCGSTDLLVTAWITANGHRIHEGDPPIDQAWCNGCQQMGVDVVDVVEPKAPEPIPYERHQAVQQP